MTRAGSSRPGDGVRSIEASKRRTVVGVLAIVCTLASQLGTAGVAGATAWNSPILVATSLGKGNGASGNVISCTSAGDCTAAGVFYTAGGGNLAPSEAFVVTETGGLWGTAVEVAGALNTGHRATLVAVSCSSPGNCSAGGSYTAASKQHAFVVSESAGVWHAAVAVGGLGSASSSEVNALSCKSNGGCEAVGTFSSGPSFRPFTLTETGGHWSKAVPLPTTYTSADVRVDALSCSTQGNCTAGGKYQVPGPNDMFFNPFAATERSGHWSKAVVIAQNVNVHHQGFLSALSCTGTGDCEAVGSAATSSGPQGFVISETDGIWGPGRIVPGSPSGSFQLGAAAYTIWCSAPGFCQAGGYAKAASGGSSGTSVDAYVVTEHAGHWGTLVHVAQSLNTDGSAATDSLSCSSYQNCVAIGWYQHHVSLTSYVEDFVTVERHGHWSTAANLPGTSAGADNNYANGVSCTGSLDCGIAGQLSLVGDKFAFVTNT